MAKPNFKFEKRKKELAKKKKKEEKKRRKLEKKQEKMEQELAGETPDEQELEPTD